MDTADNQTPDDGEALAERRGFQKALQCISHANRRETLEDVETEIVQLINYPENHEPCKRLHAAWLSGVSRGWAEVQRLVELNPYTFLTNPKGIRHD